MHGRDGAVRAVVRGKDEERAPVQFKTPQRCRQASDDGIHVSDIGSKIGRVVHAGSGIEVLVIRVIGSGLERKMRQNHGIVQKERLVPAPFDELLDVGSEDVRTIAAWILHGFPTRKVNGRGLESQAAFPYLPEGKLVEAGFIGV